MAATGDASTVDGPCGLQAVGQPVCDPLAYDDGGAGPCARHWIQGDGCCGGSVLFPCGLPAYGGGSGTANSFCAGYCMGSEQFNGCSPQAADGGERVWMTLADDGSAERQPDSGAIVQCYFDHTGRRPATLIAAPRAGARTAGEALAQEAYLEAASVAAFLDLAAQLEAHRAPRVLVRALRRAARDEVRHARDVGALARARGARPPAVELADASPRSLLALALENAREGCVRETWGAACAVAQSVRARDLEVRRAMRGIARDELRHAALSWELADWLASRLTPAGRAQVEDERARALARLEAELQGEPAEVWRDELGLPTRAEAQAMLAGMRAHVWAHAA